MRDRTQGGCHAGVAIAAALLLVAGCEHAAHSATLSQPGPERMFGDAAAAMMPHELAALTDMAERVARIPAGEAPPLPILGRHPLDGLSPKQIRELFTAAGLPADPYLPAGHPACTSVCGELTGGN